MIPSIGTLLGYPLDTIKTNMQVLVIIDDDDSDDDDDEDDMVLVMIDDDDGVHIS